MTFSQNFIKSSVLVKQLISASSIDPSDLVVEIGPGLGIITRELISQAKEVIVVEKDRDLIADLRKNFSQYQNLKIIHEDFLNWSLPQKPFKIFSNIPFNITAEIVDKLLKSPFKASEIYFIMQLEAAEKYFSTNSFNTQNSILLAPFYDVQILGDIDRTSFTPKPQVDIVFAKFTLKNQNKNLPCQGETPLLRERGFDYQQFRDFVIFGFNQWKANIFEIYKKIFSYDQLKKINHQLKINNLKPSQLNFDQWLKFFDIYTKFVSQDKKRLISGFEKKYINNIRVKKS